MAIICPANAHKNNAPMFFKRPNDTVDWESGGCEQLYELSGPNVRHET